ncbi:MAG: hypothetical protein AAF657_07330 [Acidobacteriota bacterium]
MSKFVVPLQIVVCLLALATVPARGETVYELQLNPEIESTPLNLGPWLVEPGATYQVTVVSPPSLGTLIGEVYHPSADFWQAGGDRLTVQISTSAGTIELYTLLLSPMQYTPSAGTEADFEFCDLLVSELCLPDGWDVQNANGLISLNEASPLAGNRSLEAWSPTSNASGYVNELSHHGGGGSSQSGSGMIRIGPPPGDRSLEEVTIARLGELALRVVPVDGQFYLQGQRTSCPSCTAMRPVPSDSLIRFDVWAGKKAIGPTNPIDYPAPWGWRLTLEPEGQPAVTDWVDGEAVAEKWMVGIVDSIGMAGFYVTYDELVSVVDEVEYLPIGGRADGFESAALSGWELDGPTAVVGKAAAHGLWGLSINIDDLRVLSRAIDAVVIDNSPAQATSLTGLLHVNTVDLDLENYEAIRLVRGASGDSMSGNRHLSLVLKRFDGQYRIQARAKSDSGAWHGTPWHPLTGNEHDLVVRWNQSSGPGSNDGEIHLWVGGVLVGSKLGIDNDSRVIESVAFGAHEPNLNFSHTIRGDLYLDDLASFSSD